MFDNFQKKAVFSKSLALIEKTKVRIEQIDEGIFPTSSSEDARKLLLSLLNKLSNPKLLGPMDPEVLYNRLISMSRLVDSVELSTINYISWPLVSYCNDIWASFFDANTLKVFYSLTRDHNYYISPFSLELALNLYGILPLNEIINIINSNIYCLHLSSLEDTNLPLYANIAHEFGHPLYDVYHEDFKRMWSDTFTQVHDQLVISLEAIDKNQAPRLKDRVKAVTLGLAKELLADLFGALLMGPAFILSLYEMSWGGNCTVWPIGLSPNINKIRAYPSFNFRLFCIKDYSGISNFEKDAEKEFVRLESKGLKSMASFLSKVHTSNFGSERIKVYPESDNDCGTIQDVLNKHLDILKINCNTFVEECHSFLQVKYADKLTPVNAREVSELLLRLEHDILPNIVPNGSLLGVPASFQAILNASALFRLNILTGTKTPDKIDKVSSDVKKVERLTAKALEVSYVQRQFQHREGGE